MFSGSLRQNIAFDPAGLGGDDGVHRQAIRLAAIEDDVAGFPQGLDTQIGEAGVRISGGQRQRLGLARALAAAAPRAPALLVLDDPFSAVDVATEAAIIASLRHAFGPEAPPERAGHHRPVLAPPGGLPARRHRARARAGCRGGNGHACGSPRGRRSLRAHLPGAARRRIAGDGAGTTMTGLTAPRPSVSAARAPVFRHLVSLLAQRRGSVVLVGLLVLAAAAVELVPPLVIRDIVDRHLTVGRSDGLPCARAALPVGDRGDAGDDLSVRLSRRRGGARRAQRPAHPAVRASAAVAGELFRSRADRRRHQSLHRRRRYAGHRLLVGRSRCCWPTWCAS